MNSEQKKYYGKGYAAGKKDKPEKIAEMEDSIAHLRKTISDLHREHMVLEDKIENSRDKVIFDYFWENAVDARDIRFLAQNFPDLINRKIDAGAA